MKTGLIRLQDESFGIIIQMQEKMLEQFSFAEELKEKLVQLVMYRNQSAKEVAKRYNLPNVYGVTNWIGWYKKQLAKGTIPLWVPAITYIGVTSDFNYLQFDNRCLFQKNHGYIPP